MCFLCLHCLLFGMLYFVDEDRKKILGHPVVFIDADTAVTGFDGRDNS